MLNDSNAKPLRVLLLGRKGVVVEDVREQLSMTGIELFGGTSIDDLRETLAHAPLDHVIMGGGLDLEDRLEIVREVFQLSDATTVHMKDVASGPDGFLPFVRAVLSGFRR